MTIEKQQAVDNSYRFISNRIKHRYSPNRPLMFQIGIVAKACKISYKQARSAIDILVENQLIIKYVNKDNLKFKKMFLQLPVDNF